MNKIDFLKSMGVDVETAISNMGDFETYDDIINDFYNDIPGEMSKIDNFKNASDMPNYAILVHSMKSNARSFGFMKVGDVSYAHEMASKAGDVSYVNEHYSEFVDAVKQMQDIIEKYKSI